MEWRNIETVPLDGTNVILGYLDVSGVMGARSGFYKSDLYGGQKKHPGWVCTFGGTLIDPRATHWMPFPPNPE